MLPMSMSLMVISISLLISHRVLICLTSPKNVCELWLQGFCLSRIGLNWLALNYVSRQQTELNIDIYIHFHTACLILQWRSSCKQLLSGGISTTASCQAIQRRSCNSRSWSDRGSARSTECPFRRVLICCACDTSMCQFLDKLLYMLLQGCRSA